MRGTLSCSAIRARSIHLSEFSIRGFAATNSITKTQLKSTGTIQAAKPLANAGRLNMAKASRASLNGATTNSSRRARIPCRTLSSFGWLKIASANPIASANREGQRVEILYRGNKASDRDDSRCQQAGPTAAAS